MPTTIKGSCKCGAVQYSFSCEPIAKGLCHCKNCKKTTGSAFSTNIVIPTPALNITAGEPKRYTVTNTGSGNPAYTFFCGNCGATMFSQPANAEITIIKAGTLDGERVMDEVKPGMEYFTKDRCGWVAGVEGATGYEAGFPAKS